MIGFLVFGLFGGIVARLIVPDRQQLSIWMTLLLVGRLVANALGTGDVCPPGAEPWGMLRGDPTLAARR